MFTSTKTILHIERAKLTVARVSRGKKPKIVKQKTFSYTFETFGATLKGIAKAYGKNVRIVLSDELVYVTTIAISDQVKNERSFVYSQAQEQIPDNLDKTSWDYRIKVQIPASKTHPGYKFAQFTAIQSEFFASLYKAVSIARLDVESVEAVSIALSRITKKANGPHIISYSNDHALLVAAENGLVYTTESIFETLTEEKITKLIAYVQEKFRTTPVSIFSFGNKPVPSIENMEIQQMPYGPIVGAALKSDIKGSNANTLNLSLFDISKHTISVSMPTKTPSENEESEMQPPARKSSSTGLIFVILVVIAVIAISAGTIWLTFQPDEDDIVPEKPPSTPTKTVNLPSPTTTESEPDEVDRTAYTIRVLNGTNTPSNEAVGQSLLIDEGFTVLETASAEDTSYLQTIILASRDVDRFFIDELKKVLSSHYDVEVSEIEPRSDIDVEIVIGSIYKNTQS